MRFAPSFKVLGLLLMIFSLSMLTPVIVALIYQDGAISPFILSFIITFGTGGLLYIWFMHNEQDMTVRDGFLVVVLFWTVLSMFGAIPFMLDPIHKLNFTDAVFESVSGLTTTGATVLSGLSQLPHSILYYRSQLHFLGGMGIIVLAVAIMPILGVGGMQMARAETSGPFKNSKIKPRMAETAKALWGVYVGLVAACAIAFWLAGMKPFDAICDAYSTLSTGGFSTHDSSFAYYHSNVINIIAIVFMFMGAVNFSLHYYFFKEKKLSAYFRDVEFRAYVYWLLGLIGITAVTLFVYDHFAHVWKDLVDAAFTIISFSSDTGLSVTDYSNWPTFLPYMLMFVAIIGGCAGSTAGGIKMIRVLLLRAQGKRELVQLIHPDAVVVAKLGNDVLPQRIVQMIWAFVAVFVAVYMFLFLLLLASGLDLETSFTALSTTISNAGAGIGALSGSFEGLNTMSKWICSFAMIAGRLEIFTLLVLFTREFWRR